MKRPVCVATAIVAMSLVGASEAAAFCRTTTCVCTHPAPAGKNLAPTESACPDECPRDENGCQLKGTPVAWRGGCVGFSLNLAGTSTLTVDQWQDAISRAFLAWTAVDCGDGRRPSIDVVQLRNVACAKSVYLEDGPNVNVVYFDDNGWGENKDIDGTLALTKVHFHHDGPGDLLDADMAINSGRRTFTIGDDAVEEDLVSVVTHEVGHFLGLDHSPNEDASMFWTYPAGTIKRQLSADDIAGICAVYPPGRKTTCDPVPHGGFGDTCPDVTSGCTVSPSEDSTGTLLPFALATLGIVIHRFRARRNLS